MSNLGPVWEDDEDYSPARFNAKSIHRDTGTNLVAIAATKQLGLVIPTDTSGGLIKNVTYYVDYDSSFNRIEFRPIFAKHLHDTNTDEAGGLLADIMLANSANYAQVELLDTADPERFDVVATGGTLTFAGSLSDARYELKTTTTTNNHVTGIVPGIHFGFASAMLFQFNADYSHNTNFLLRIGVNVDGANETPSTSRRMFGLEGCDGHGTNYVLINANGNTSSLQVTATTAPIVAGAETNYKIVHTPATEDRFYLNGTSNAVSGTNVASSGDTIHGRLMMAGTKLTAGATEKTLKLWYMQLKGNPTSGTGEMN